MTEIEYVGKVDEGDSPRPILLLIEALVAIHGPCKLTREESGYHIYIPSPYCLAKNGRDELWKKHLAVNAEKYLGIGRFSGKGKKSDYAARCMKSGVNYTVSELLEMPTLEQRGIKNVKRKVQILGNPDFIVEDEAGNKISEAPGRVESIIDLPDDHPAVFYLKSRNFDPQRLWEQFRLSWCEEEMPEDKVKGRYYPRLPGGFKDTPQGL